MRRSDTCLPIDVLFLTCVAVTLSLGQGSFNIIHIKDGCLYLLLSPSVLALYVVTLLSYLPIVGFPNGLTCT